MTGAKWKRQAFLLLLAVCTSAQVQAQDNAFVVTPTPVVFPAPTSPYPELICPYFQKVEAGNGWQNVKVGISTQSDLELTLEQFGSYDVVYPNEGSIANSIRYSWRGSTNSAIKRQAPIHVDICVQNAIITVMEVSSTNQQPVYLDDLIVGFGLPDVTIWSSVIKRRAVFWFEAGAMAEVFVQHGDAASFGRITRIIYFPPQSSEGYEGRWPFTITRREPFYSSDPSIPSEQNPFDFNAMIATITSEPSRTPTPTPTATTP